MDGVAIEAAEQRKRQRYPELTRPSREAELVVMACETGGRWSERSAAFVQQLAAAKAQSAPRQLRGSAECCWQHRWAAILAVAAQSSLAASLLGHDPWSFARNGFTPGLDRVLEGSPEFSRLPLRPEEEE